MSDALNTFMHTAQSKVEALAQQRAEATAAREQFEAAELAYATALEDYDTAYNDALGYGLPRELLKESGFEALDRAERRRVKDLEKSLEASADNSELDDAADNEEN